MLWKIAKPKIGPIHPIPTASIRRMSLKLEIFPKANCANQNPSVARTPEYASAMEITAMAIKTARLALAIPPAL